MATLTGVLGRGRPQTPAAADHVADRAPAGRTLRFRGDARSLLTEAFAPAPLPPLPPAPRLDVDVITETPALPALPAWSPLVVAGPLFALVWICFGVLAALVDQPAAAEVAGLGRLLASGAAVTALVLVTLSVADAQISGLRPRLSVVAVVALGLGQGLSAGLVSGGDDVDLWGAAGWLFVLVGVAVPLAWVGGQFQCAVRRQRVQHDASLTASWMERARRQAHQTVQSVHRHDVRSMLFVVDGAARTLVDGSLTAEQRGSFSEMLSEGVQRLATLIDVRAEEIEPFAVEDVARAVAHAERKAGRRVTVDLPAGVSARGRAADVAAVLRTLAAVTGRRSTSDVRLRAERTDGIVVVRVEPASGGSHRESRPLLTGDWDAICAETFKPSRQKDEESVDLYVAARLLAEQGADLWSTAERGQFAVRLPAAWGPMSGKAHDHHSHNLR